MTAPQTYDDWLLDLAERWADPPATCDECKAVVEHASDLNEIATEQLVCDECLQIGW